MKPYTFRRGTDDDWPQIAALLNAAGLPIAGAETHRRDFLLAFQQTSLVGTALLERYEDTALLRSVAVDAREQGHGLGQVLVRQALDQAQQIGIKQVVLLTTTAAGFFPRFGFRPIQRAETSQEVQASIEFQEACPASATVMSIVLDLETHMDSCIRLVRSADAPAIQAIYAPVVTSTPTSFELTPPTVAEMQERIAQKLLTHPWVVYEIQGMVVGYAHASSYRPRAAYQWSVEVSVYLHEQWRGQGVGRALYTSLFALLRLQGFYSVYAGITLPNPASVALHEAMGMRPVGVYQQVGYKLGTWHDVGWWQGALQSHSADPAPPLSFAQAQTREDWVAALASGMSMLAERKYPRA